ncbi:Uncharacterised protein [Salmonella bongori]|nr:Uncharacterised protein [Salmonella bongori]
MNSRIMMKSPHATVKTRVVALKRCFTAEHMLDAYINLYTTFIGTKILNWSATVVVAEPEINNEFSG